MRIVMVCPIVGEAFGQERVMVASARLLVSAGHRVSFIGERRVGAIAEVPGEVRIVPNLTKVNHLSSAAEVGATIEKIMASIAESHADLVHFMDPLDSRILSTINRALPTVLTAHTVSPTCPASHRLIAAAEAPGVCARPGGLGCLPQSYRWGCCGGGFIRRSHRVAEFLLRARVLKKFDRFIANSDYMVARLRGDGFSSSRISKVPNPVSVTVAAPGAWNTRVPKIICAARGVKQKGLEFLIAALGRIADLAWDAEIYGDGPERENIGAVISRAGLAARIRLNARVVFGELQQKIAESFVYVQPSVGPESFGLAVAEALMIGVPVVTSRVPALNELVRDGLNGLLVTPGDPMDLGRTLRKLLENPELRERLARAAPGSLAGRFTPELHLEGTLNAYDQAIQRRRLVLKRGALPV